jgi:hypothetical protein
VQYFPLPAPWVFSLLTEVELIPASGPRLVQ